MILQKKMLESLCNNQPKCVNFVVIIHCLSISCKNINLIFFTITSKQLIVTKQFTARADLFLNNLKEEVNSITHG